MKRLKMGVAACALLGAATITAWAATEVVNDLSPFDNTIEDAYWNTKAHPQRTVEAESHAMAEGFDSAVTSDVTVKLEAFSSMPSGFIVIIQ